MSGLSEVVDGLGRQLGRPSVGGGLGAAGPEAPLAPLPVATGFSRKLLVLAGSAKSRVGLEHSSLSLFHNRPSRMSAAVLTRHRAT